MKKSIKIATWNVNSIRVRLELLAELVKKEEPDVICLQEIKCVDASFPLKEVRELGYPCVAIYGMAGYNGVAILSKTPLKDVAKLDWVGKNDARNIQATVFDDVIINCLYIPSGGNIADPIENISFAHKLAFMDDVAEFFEHKKDVLQNKKMIICGDFNVAPLPDDVWNHKKMLKVISHTPVETERLTRFMESLDFVDVVRKKYPEPLKVYTWWSYRNPGGEVKLDKGRRLDHIWVTKPLEKLVKNAKIVEESRFWDRPSDHVPVIVEIEL